MQAEVVLAGEVAVADGGGDALDALGSPHGNGAEGDEVVVAGAQADVSLEKSKWREKLMLFFSFCGNRKDSFLPDPLAGRRLLRPPLPRSPVDWAAKL